MDGEREADRFELRFNANLVTGDVLVKLFLSFELFEGEVAKRFGHIHVA